MAATARLSRSEQAGRNRALVLAAASEVFLRRGYHAATLEQIAEAAGFSKGVVYSQFDGKADLFMALLEARIAERAAENEGFAATLAGDDGVRRLVRRYADLVRTDAPWRLLLVEFRVHAARHPELNARYARAHARTIDSLAAALAAIYARGGTQPPLPARRLAVLLLALATGIELEEATDARALGGDRGLDQIAALITRSPS
jgi:AcrR family transcriptional regulator